VGGDKGISRLSSGGRGLAVRRSGNLAEVLPTFSVFLAPTGANLKVSLNGQGSVANCSKR